MFPEIWFYPFRTHEQGWIQLRTHGNIPDSVAGTAEQGTIRIAILRLALKSVIFQGISQGASPASQGW